MKQIAVLFLWLAGSCGGAYAGGNYPNDELHQWFDSLKSKKGPCCSFADGISIGNIDWDMKENSYRVRLCETEPPRDGDIKTFINNITTCPNKVWITVPDDAVVYEPNKFGSAVVWPYWERSKTLIRCFMPGSGS